MITSYKDLETLVWGELMAVIAPEAIISISDTKCPTPEELASGKYFEIITTPEPDKLMRAEEAPPVRRSWAINGAPEWNIAEDVVFMQLSEAEDDINRPLDDEWLEHGEDFIRRTGITRVFSLKLNAYGPNCYDNLLRTRMAFLAGRKELKENKVFLVPERAAIVRAPELFQGRWWDRADTELKLNALFVSSNEVRSIESVNVEVGINRQRDSKEVLHKKVCVK